MRALPPLDESDGAVRASLGRVDGMQPLLPLLAPRGLVRRLVATVHHASHRSLPAKLYPVAPAAGSAVAREDRSVLGPADFARHAPYVRALESVDAGALVAVYVRLYPLFQEAHRAHAGGAGHFNDALVAAIDHLLAPQATAPPPVVLRRGGEVTCAGSLACTQCGRPLRLAATSQLEPCRGCGGTTYSRGG